MAEKEVIDVASAVASKAAESLFYRIQRVISYVFKYQSYVEKLRSQLGDLKNRKQRLEQKVENARTQGDEIYDDVKQCSTKMDELIARAEKLINEEGKVKNKRCFKGLCPNLMSGYKLSKEAVNAAKEAAILLTEAERLVEKDVSHPPAPERPKITNVARGYQQFGSRTKVFHDVMEALKDSNVNMIGVYGMGGVGKTTLAKQVGKKVVEDKLFDEVVMAEVTQTQDLKTIQDEIAKWLGFAFPPHENKSQRVDRLRKVLKEKRVLVILDNIWAELKLEDVGIPFGDDKKEGKDVQRRCTVLFGDDKKEGKDVQRRCTVLLTSRSEHVLCNVMNSQKNFPIEVLSDAEAVILFRKTVEDHSTETSYFEHLADEIVRKCEGLPVAIKTIAGALKNKKIEVWRNALNRLCRNDAIKILGMDTNVYSAIKLSYDFLVNAEAKSLFRLCALQKDGSRIPIYDLMMYGMGLGCFTTVGSLEEVRDTLHTLIDDLKSSCLLMDGDNEHVKMHDIIHDVGVSIAAEEHMFNLQNVDNLENVIPKDSVAISLTCRDIDELPPRLECPKLNLLSILANDGSSLQIQNLFSEEMKELRVLNLTQIVFPPSLVSACLNNLRTLSLIDCHSLVDVALVGELTKLQILSFRGSDIEQLPLKIGQLRRLKLLDLSDCSRLEVIAPNVISKLSQLEELYMVNSFTRWEKGEGGSNASVVELKALSKLTTLEINFPDVEIVPQDLVSVELERFKIILGDERPWMYAYNEAKISRTLEFSGHFKNGHLVKAMKMLLKKIEDLYLNELNDVHNVHELDDGEGFPQLKSLSLNNSPDISSIVNFVRHGGHKAFPSLESLVLDKLIKLEEICHGQLTEDQSFSKLRIIKVKECHKLKRLFSFSMAKNLSRLQEIEVTDCKGLKLFVGEERGNYAVYEIEDNNEVTFPALETLILSKHSMQYRWLDYIAFKRENLTEVEVKDCDDLKFVFSYSMVPGLVQLQNLVVEGWESMEWVINTNGLRRDEDQIGVMAFPKLKSLTIVNLPRLKRFVFMSSTVENKIVHRDTNVQSLFDDEKVTFPILKTLKLSKLHVEKIWHDQASMVKNLTKLEVSSCDHLKFLFSYSMVPSLVQLQTLEIRHCNSIEWVINNNGLRRDEEQVNGVMVFPKLKSFTLYGLPKLTRFISMSSSEENNITQSDTNTQYLFDEKVTFPALEELMLYRLNMEKIWHDQASMVKNLTKLEVSSCNHLKFLFSYSMVPSLVQLQTLEIIGCNSMEWVINTNGLKRDEGQIIGVLAFPKLKSLNLTSLPKLTRFIFMSLSEENNIIQSDTNMQYLFDEKVTFPALEKLRLSSLNIEKIWFDQVSIGENLTKLEVSLCNHLKFLFSYSMVPSLVQLQNLYISGCKSMEWILFDEKVGFPNHMVDEEFPIASTSIETTRRFLVFPQLTSMIMGYLPGLKSIYQGVHMLEWPTLENLNVHNCEKVEILFGSSELLSRGTQSQPPVFLIDHHKVAFPNLKTLEVHHCKRLRYLVTLSMVEILIKLARIEIGYCNLIEEIVQQIGEVKVDPIVFSQLVGLKLNNLPRLEHFFGADYTLKFPYLEQMVVSGCLNMKIFSQGALCTPKLQKVELIAGYQKETEDRWEGSLNSTIQKMFEEMAGFYGVDELILSQDPLVKEKWYGQTSPESFFCSLRTLVVDDCKLMSSAIPANRLRCLKNLNTLTIKNCDSAEEGFHTEELNTDEHSVPLFPHLRSLHLIDLPNLKKFCNFNGNVIELPLFKNLSIKNCPNIETFISNSTHAPPLFNEKVAFSLWWLKLSKLPKLLYLCKESSSPIHVFQMLRTLKILECGKLEQVVPSWVSFHSLVEIEVSKCDGLINLMALSTAHSMMELKRMKITNCKMIEDIIHVREELEKDCVVFSRLEYLELSCLPSITSFCLENYTIEFPSLEQVIVRVPKDENFFSGSLKYTKVRKITTD